MPIENIVVRENAGDQHILLFPQCFIPYQSQICFKKHLIFRLQNAFNMDKATPFPKQAFVFMCLQYKSFENTVEKGEIACNKQFLLISQCFLPFWKTFCQFL